MSSMFWEDIIIVIFFFYGLAFYSLGLALLVESVRASELELARSMRLLGGFGLLHGVHEWLDMLGRGINVYYGMEVPATVSWFRLVLLVTSFLALLAFGEHLLARDGANRLPLWGMTIIAFSLYFVLCIWVQVANRLTDAEWMLAIDVLARYLIGIPGAMLACWALWRQQESFREHGISGFVNDLIWSAFALALYGGVGQLFVSKSIVFPSNFLNSELFLDMFGFPVQLLRAVLATIIAIFMIRVLRALEVENEQRLRRIEQSKIEIERQNHRELARLHAELQDANNRTANLLEEVQRRDELRGQFIQRITAAQEAERRRIARELHDDTGQTLTGIALGLRGLGSVVNTNPELLARRLPVLEAMATESIGQLRRLIYDLRPPQLDDMGLVAALRFLIERFDDDDRIHIDLSVMGEVKPQASEIETALFRIIQETLTNVIKHAHAESFHVTLDYSNGLSIKMQDNGIGFDVEASMRPDGPRKAWGLLGIQERAKLINADLNIDSELNEGTTIRIDLKNDIEEIM